MSDHPTTFAAEPSSGESFGWDDRATLHRRDDGGLLHDFRSRREGTFAELVRFVAALPEEDRAGYVIDKAGDREFELAEIMGLARRVDFPG